jgi:hypothetical protein
LYIHIRTYNEFLVIYIGSFDTPSTKPTEQSIPAISARLCRLPEQELHQQSKQSKNCTNKTYRAIISRTAA